MEYNQKLRGEKHHKNKARYKSKQKIQNKRLEAFCQHKYFFNMLESSSSEEETDEESEDENLELDDFSVLAQAPISVGGHFQFKSDKIAETASGFDNLFSLDLDILQYSLNCILFAERCGLDKSFFTESELQDMYSRAQSNKVQYESYLRIMSASKHDSISECDSTVQPQIQSNLPEEALQKIDDIPKETIVASDEKQVGNTNPLNKEKVEVGKAELEDWLDDILGD